MKLFFELIKKGLPFELACKGADVTAEQVQACLNEQGEEVTAEQLSEAVAAKVLEKLAAKSQHEQKPQPAFDSKVLAGEVAASLIPMIDEKIAAATNKQHQHVNPGSKGLSSGAPAVIPGKPVGYAKLHKYQQQLFDSIIAARKGSREVMDFDIDITDGEAAEIRSARKRAGLSDAKINGKSITIFGRKALDSSANDGADWIPTNMASALHLRMGEITSIASIFEQFTQSSKVEDYPVGTTRPTFYLESTTTGSGTESSLRTAKATMTAQKIIGKTDIQDDTSEDSLINLMPLVEQSLAEGAVNCVANVILNGDTTATHMDSDTETVATHANRAWIGLRKYGLNVADLKKDIAAGGISTGNLSALIAMMGKYALQEQAARCRIILGVKGVTSWRSLAQITDPQTPNAWSALISGELPPYLGIPFAIESQHREDLNASGVYDGTTKTKGSIIVVNGANFVLSTYKNITFEVERSASGQKNTIYAKFRKAFTPFETPSATIPTVVIGYNYTA